MASKAIAKDPRKKFDELRSKYLAAVEKRSEHDSSMRARYGGDYQDSWLRAGERTVLNKLRDKVWQAGDAFLDHVKAISPRDWRGARRLGLREPDLRGCRPPDRRGVERRPAPRVGMLGSDQVITPHR